MRLSPVFERTLIACTLLGAALTLSACDQTRSLGSLKQPVVATQSVTRDISFTPEHSIAPQEAQSLQGFLVSLNLGSGDRLVLDDPNPEGAAARRAAVNALVARSGGQLLDAPPPAPTAMPVGTARLWIVRAQAIAPACPDWSSNPMGNMTGASHSNYGCALNSNFAAMVSDPNDLAEGRRYDGSAAKDIVKSHDYWQRRVPTGFEKELADTNTKNDGNK